MSPLFFMPTIGNNEQQTDKMFRHKGHAISIRTINLKQHWQSIHRDLLALVA
jgi:hypothetical protein